jgi:hypothetical protein
MPCRRIAATAGGAVLALLLSGCGGGEDEGSEAARQPTTAAPARPAATTSTGPPIEGVQTYLVDAGHREGPLTYPQTPPVGGIHNPLWMTCGYYDQPVPNERAVHSLEHGAIWITYRSDVPPADVEQLAALARSRGSILVSPWDATLPSPVVVTAWGRQLRLESVADPPLMQFVSTYVNQGPEINAPC